MTKIPNHCTQITDTQDTVYRLAVKFHFFNHAAKYMFCRHLCLVVYLLEYKLLVYHDTL